MRVYAMPEMWETVEEKTLRRGKIGISEINILHGDAAMSKAILKARIQKLEEENERLKEMNKRAYDNGYLEACGRYRKALEVLERTVAQIWDCKYEADKIHIIINRVFGTPDNLLKKYKNDLYGISKEDLQIAAEALKEMSDG